MAKGKTTKKAVKKEEIKDAKKVEKLEIEEKDVKEEKADEQVEVMSLDNDPV